MIQREISNKSYQMDCLDGLRGFAALLVVFSHTSNEGMYFVPFLDLRGAGKSGVFLFFILSAFLLTLPLLRKGKAIFSITEMSHYWQRRIFRIYPLYTVYLLCALISTYLVVTLLNKQQFGLPFALDWQGFVNHMTLQAGKSVTWSIAVEFKFYFILPFLVLAIGFARRGGPYLLITIYLTSMVLTQVIFPQHKALNTDVRLLPYLPIFLTGVFLAVLQDYLNAQPLTAKALKLIRVLGVIGVLGIVIMTPAVFSLFGEPVEKTYFHQQFILYSILWSMILLAAVNTQGWLQRFFSLPGLRFFGALSFSLYLFHPIFIEVLERLGIGGYVAAWTVLVGTTGLSYLSFKVLEGPVSRYKLSWPPFGGRIVKRGEI